MTHELKIQKQWADAKLAGEKPFEIRKNDRGFQKGDIVHYTVIDPKTGEPWSRPASGVPFHPDGRHPLEICDFIITYVREGADGLEKGYCVYADQPVPSRVSLDEDLKRSRERDSLASRVRATHSGDRPEGLCKCSDADKTRTCPYRTIKSTGDECFNPEKCEWKHPVSADLGSGATPSNGTGTPLAPPSPLAEIAK